MRLIDFDAGVIVSPKNNNAGWMDRSASDDENFNCSARWCLYLTRGLCDCRNEGGALVLTNMCNFGFSMLLFVSKE